MRHDLSTKPSAISDPWAVCYRSRFSKSSRSVPLIALSILLFCGSGSAQDIRGLLSAALERQVPNRRLPDDLLLSGIWTSWRGEVQPFRLIVKGKDRVRYEVGVGTTMTITVMNQGSAWTERAGKRELLQPHSARQRPALVPFLDLLFDFEKPTAQITDRGMFSIGSSLVRGVTFKLPDPTPNSRAFRQALDDVADFYIDQNLLVVRSERTITADNNLEIHLRSVLEFSDYRTTQGLAVPFRIVNTLTGPGLKPKQSVYVIQNVASNSGISDGEFVPAEIRR